MLQLLNSRAVQMRCRDGNDTAQRTCHLQRCSSRGFNASGKWDACRGWQSQGGQQHFSGGCPGYPLWGTYGVRTGYTMREAGNEQ